MRRTLDDDVFTPLYLKKCLRGFPGGAVVESPPADAGDAGSCPSPGVPHAAERLGP